MALQTVSYLFEPSETTKRRLRGEANSSGHVRPFYADHTLRFCFRPTPGTRGVQQQLGRQEVVRVGRASGLLNRSGRCVDPPFPQV